MDTNLQQGLTQIQGIMGVVGPYLLGLGVLALFYRILR